MWPGVALLAMFVILVIMLILRYGSKWLKLRHVTHSERNTGKEWESKSYYEHSVSVA
jgi:hypothetical protein